MFCVLVLEGGILAALRDLGVLGDWEIGLGGVGKWRRKWGWKWDGIIEKTDYLYMLRSMREFCFFVTIYFIHLPTAMTTTRESTTTLFCLIRSHS